MKQYLISLLGDEDLAMEWTRKPIKEWFGFTVSDMFEFGFAIKVTKWFDNLSDEDIMEINKIRTQK